MVEPHKTPTGQGLGIGFRTRKTPSVDGRYDLLSAGGSRFRDRLSTLSAKMLPEHYQCRGRRESQDEPADWDGVSIHEILAQRESGMCGPRDR